MLKLNISLNITLNITLNISHILRIILICFRIKIIQINNYINCYFTIIRKFKSKSSYYYYIYTL